MIKTVAIKRKLEKVKSCVGLKSKPSFISISITHNCSLQCKICDIWKLPKDKQLTTSQIKQAVSDLHSWLGSFEMNIAGGEPLLHKGIFEIIKYARQKGILVNMTSNGIHITKSVANKLVESGLNAISISLDSTDHEIHDHIRNKEGLHKLTIKNVLYLNAIKKDLSVNIATVMMGFNAHTLLSLLDLVEANNLDGINFQPLINNFATEYEPGWHEQSAFWPNPEQLSQLYRVIDELIRKKHNGGKIHNTVQQLHLMKAYFNNPLEHAKLNCNVGQNNFAIDEYGNVLICFFFKKVGNITKTKPEKIWISANADRLRKQISNCKRNCDLLNCNYD